MKRSSKARGAGADPGQLFIDWSNQPAATPAVGPPVVPTGELPPPDPYPSPRETGLVQSLPWDFRTSFPEPTQEAIEAGVVCEEDLTPDAIRGLHHEHAGQALAALRDLDTLLDARRRGLDPTNGRPPSTEAAAERLQQLFESEPGRLERWWQSLMDSYESAFGAEAANAFSKALRAWHAGVDVTVDGACPTPPPPASRPDRKGPQPAHSFAETPAAATAVESAAPARSGPRPPHRRPVARLPVPRPLPSAVAAGHFGKDDRGPIDPSPDEVRAITENHADRIIDLLDGLRHLEHFLAAPQCGDRARLYHECDALHGKVVSAITRYAEDFGPEAAERLEAYARREASLRSTSLTSPGQGR